MNRRQPMFDVELMRSLGFPISKADYSWMDRMDTMTPEEFMYRTTLSEAMESGDKNAMRAAQFYKRVWQAAEAQGNPANFSYSEPGGGYATNFSPAAAPALPQLAMPETPAFATLLLDALGR